MKKFQPTSTMLKIESYAQSGVSDGRIARYLGITEMQVSELRTIFREGLARGSSKEKGQGRTNRRLARLG